MYGLDDTGDTDPDGAQPAVLRSVETGDFSDAVIESGLGDHRDHLYGSVWNPGEKVYITDHHNKVMAPCLAASNEWFNEDILLVHIDLHRDDNEPIEPFEKIENLYLRSDTEGLVEKTGISEIMYVAKELGMFEGSYFWGSVDPVQQRIRNSLEELEPPIDDYERMVLDVDLDVFEGVEDTCEDTDLEVENYYDSYQD